MKKYCAALLLVALSLMILSPLLFLAPQPCQAADVTIAVSADKYYISGEASNNWHDGDGTDVELLIGNTSFSSYGDCYAALKFPLTTLTSAVKKAELCVYVSNLYDDPDRHIYVKGSTDTDWVDNDQISPGASTGLLATGGPYTATGLVKLDVTSFVQERNTAGATALTFLLTGDSPDHQLAIYDRSDTGSRGAYLDITYTQAPVATTNAATGLTSTGATLNGTVNARGLASTVTFSYGTTTGYGTTVNAIPNTVNDSSDTSVSASLTGLAPNTTYHYRVSAVNSDGTTNGSDVEFTTPAALPTVTTGAAGTPTATGVTLNGTVNANNASTTVTFQYGTTHNGPYGSSAAATPGTVTGTTGTAVSSTLSGLTPGTIYYYIVRGENSAGTADGLEGTFTTDTATPTATTNTPTGVSTTGATLNGTINANAASTAVTFEYGTDTSYGTVVSATPATVTGTTNTSVSYSLGGLTPNTTYHYRVVGVNAKGTTNGSDSSFTTGAAAPTVTTGAAGIPTATGVTLNGNVNANNSSTTVTFLYGTASGGPYTSSAAANESPVTGTIGTAVSCSLTGLTPSTTYYYIVRGVSGGGTTDGLEGTFTTAGIAPAATTDAASGISSTGATLNATVNPNNSSTTVNFEYGTDTGYGSTIAATGSPLAAGTAGVAASKVMTGLTPNTTYHYRVAATNATGTTYGSDQSFTTGAAAPTVTTGAAGTPTATGVTLNGNVNANNSSTTVTFLYGTASGGPYTSSAAANESPVTGTTGTAVSCSLTGLTPSTTYYYIVRGVSGGGTTDGLEGTFTTAGIAPAATTDAASGISSTGATLNATVNPNNSSTTVNFEYGTDTGYGSTIAATGSPLAAGTAGVAASKVMTGLTPNTTYHYRVAATNATGTTYGSDQSFTTSAIPPTVATNPATLVNPTSAQLNGTVNANNASTAVTFEYGTNNGGPYTSSAAANESPVTGTTGTAVSCSLSGLTPSTTYYYIVRGISGGGTTDGLEGTFTTPGAAPIVSVGEASNISGTGITLNGSVNPGNDSSDVIFEYGTTAAYGTVVNATPHTLTGTTSQSVNAALTGLTPGITYHYRISATNATGITNSPDCTFTISSSDSVGPGGPGDSGDPGGPSSPDHNVTVTVNSTNGVVITVPSGVIPSNSSVQVTVITAGIEPLAGEGQFFASQVFDITLSNGSVNGTMQITLPFDPALINRLTHTVTIEYYNESAHSWVTVPGCSINWASGLVTTSIDHLTEFAVVAKPLNATDIDQVSGNPLDANTVTAPQFNDISGHWAEDDIMRLSSLSIVGGYPDGSFKPGQPITRAEFVVLIVKALRLEITGESSGFQDCCGFWGDGAIAAACNAGLIEGYEDGRFGPNDPITREQVATIAVKALNSSPRDEDTAAKILAAYGDHGQVSPWAAGYVAAATASGLVNGCEDGSFAPGKFTARAEAVSIVCRILDRT